MTVAGWIVACIAVGWALYWRRQVAKQRRARFAALVRLHESRRQTAAILDRYARLIVLATRQQERADGLREIAAQAATMARLFAGANAGPGPGPGPGEGGAV